MYRTGSWKETTLYKSDILINIWQKWIDYTLNMSLCITKEFSTRILTTNLRISQKITTLKKQDGGTCQNLLIVHDTAEAHLINHFTATD